ncbi:MAG TPA: nitroreductase/quinone reductase family protein [Acidimicrobiales bacterium]|nr:nitroreductase/quinone reductase family protein [Acidimicrobiales bacterium]
MSEVDFNTRIIEEFRSNGGRVGGPFEGAPMVLLHHVGRRTGTERVNPLVTLPLERGWAVFASKAGAPTSPDWYHNLMAHPRTTLEIGTESHEVIAREASGEERDRIYARQKQVMPGFAEYETKAAEAGRVIPVVVLEPAGAG